jgi:polyisoprenoid-binding protein YceI
MATLCASEQPARNLVIRIAIVRALALAAFVYFGDQIAEAGSAWTVNPANARITFVVESGGQPQAEGHFTSFRGEIALDFDNPRTSSALFNVDANSVDVGSPSFNEYLRSEPFFNITKYPSISFVSTGVEKIDEGHAHVTGDLTFLGEIRPISLDVEVDRKLTSAGLTVSLRATGMIDRREFGMDIGYPVVSETVRLIVTTEFVGAP